MSNYDTLEAEYYEWRDNPEPALPAMDPRVILDDNIEGQSWLYDIEHEGTRWLTYHGESIPLVR